LKNNKIKIADFGSAIDLSVSLANDYAGINEYISPEILCYSSELSLLNLEKENITVKADIW
jgi:serine/threonine protein kinase